MKTQFLMYTCELYLINCLLNFFQLIFTAGSMDDNNVITIKSEEVKCLVTGTGSRMLAMMAWQSFPIGTILLNWSGGN